MMTSSPKDLEESFYKNLNLELVECEELWALEPIESTNIR
jgi:hypothetical protein